MFVMPNSILFVSHGVENRLTTFRAFLSLFVFFFFLATTTTLDRFHADALSSLGFSAPPPV